MEGRLIEASGLDVDGCGLREQAVGVSGVWVCQAWGQSLTLLGLRGQSGG